MRYSPKNGAPKKVTPDLNSTHPIVLALSDLSDTEPHGTAKYAVRLGTQTQAVNRWLRTVPELQSKAIVLPGISTIFKRDLINWLINIDRNVARRSK